MEKIIAKYFWILIPLILAPALWGLTPPGFYGASDDMHPAWIQQIDRTLKLGQVPPRFVPDLSFGFGYPLFNFISPLPFYIGELFHLAGLNFVDSVKATFAASMVCSALVMFLLVRHLSGPLIGIVAALVYIYTPYRATDLYVRGAIGELWAFVFYPLIILAIINTSQGSGLRWVGIGGLGLTGLILSHNIGTYMFLPFAVMLALILNKNLLRHGLMFLVGISASSYFWLPALIESRLMRYDTLFSFADHFPTLKQLVTPYFGYGGSTPGPNDTMSFFIGVANLAILVLGVVAVVIYRRKMEVFKLKLILWSMIVFGAATFLMNHRSTLLWIHLPLLDYFQFPWRFLMMTTLVAPLFLVSLPALKHWRSLLILVGVLAFITTFNYFQPEDQLGRTDEYFLARYIPTPVAKPEYYQIQEEYLRLPKATQFRPDKNYPSLSGDDDTIKFDYQYDGLKLWGSVQASSSAVVAFNKYYFPGWVATLDGHDVEIKTIEPFGQMEIAIPEGNHRLEFRFTELPYKLILDVLSLVSILTAVFLAVKGGFRWRKV